MSYLESYASCGWCRHAIDDKGEVACGDCYTKLETYVSDLEKEIQALREELKERKEE